MEDRVTGDAVTTDKRRRLLSFAFPDRYTYERLIDFFFFSDVTGWRDERASAIRYTGVDFYAPDATGLPIYLRPVHCLSSLRGLSDVTARIWVSSEEGLKVPHVQKKL